MTVRAGLVLAAAVALAGCSDSGTAGLDMSGNGTLPGGIVGAPSNQNDASLMGYWIRRLVILDNSGGFSESATEWSFETGGTGYRLQISRNYTAFLADTAITDIEWTTNAGRVTVEFLPPASGTVNFGYRVLADTLFLDELKFVHE